MRIHLYTYYCLHFLLKKLAGSFRRNHLIRMNSLRTPVLSTHSICTCFCPFFIARSLHQNINFFYLRDLIKLTAMFVARNGRPFLTQLMNREMRNFQFDFLKPQHSNFAYFTKLVEQYTKVCIYTAIRKNHLLIRHFFTFVLKQYRAVNSC